MTGEAPGGERGRSTWGALEPRIERALRLGIPPAIYLAATLAAYLTLPFDRFLQWFSFMNGYLVLPLGREFTIPLMIAAGFGAPESVGLVVLVDFMAASFIAWNLDLARQVPYLGGFIRGAEASGKRWRDRYPSLHALGVVGLFLWAVKPGRGSGGATAAVLGKLVFVDTRWLLPTIMAASLIGCTLVAVAAETLVSVTGQSLWLVSAATLIALGVVYGAHIRRELAGRISGALHRHGTNPGED